jgi:hypothetical protein
MKIAFIVVCFISTVAIANVSDTTSGKFSMSYELNAGPSYGDKGYTSIPWFSGSYSVNEKRKDLFGEPNFGFTNALNFQFGNWFRLRTRLSYNRVSYHSDYKNGIYIGFDATTGAGYTSGSYKYLFRQFTAGLDFCFVFSGDKIKFNTGFGLDYGQYIRSYFVNGKKANQLQYAANPDESFVNRGFTSFVGIEIPVKKITLFSELRYTMTNPTNIQDKYWNYLYSVNLSAGLRLQSITLKSVRKELKTRNALFTLSVEPKASYLLNGKPGGYGKYKFTNHYGLLTSAGFKFQNGLLLSSGFSYLVLNKLYSATYYDDNYYSEFHLVGLHLAASCDMLNKNSNHILGPFVRVEYAILTSQINAQWNGEISSPYPPDNAQTSTGGYKKGSDCFVVASGLTYSRKIGSQNALGLGLEYSRQLMKFKSTGSYWHYLSLSIIWQYSFRKNKIQ